MSPAGGSVNGRFAYNIRPACCVFQTKMKRLFRVRGIWKDGAVVWFVNRSAEAGWYALDEAFTREEAESLAAFLQRRNLECRIQEIPPQSAGSEGSPAWNLISRIVEMDQEDADRLPFAVVGCIET